MSEEDYKGPLRATWRVQFATTELKAECQRRMDSHAAHAAYWENELAALYAELEDSQAVETVKVTGGEQRVLRYDQGLANKVTGAETRREHHRACAAEYRRWIILLEKEKDRSLPLRYDDVTFFFAPIKELPADG